MKNVNVKVSGKILILEVNLEERLGKSASGKTTIVATTEGNIAVPGFPDIKLGLNCYTK